MKRRRLRSVGAMMVAMAGTFSKAARSTHIDGIGLNVSRNPRNWLLRSSGVSMGGRLLSALQLRGGISFFARSSSENDSGNVPSSVSRRILSGRFFNRSLTSMSTSFPVDTCNTPPPPPEDKVPPVLTSLDPRLDRLARVRAAMEANGWDALVVPSEDPHMNEYVTKRYERRSWLTDFHGSTGLAIVTTNRAALFVDGRYHTQADQDMKPTTISPNSEIVDETSTEQYETQSPSGWWEVVKEGLPTSPTPISWLSSALPNGATVALDPNQHSVESIRRYASQLQARGLRHVLISPSEVHPVDMAWGNARPSLPAEEIRVHPITLAGSTVTEKIEKVQAQMTRGTNQKRADLLVISALDEVAWLLNLRGADLECCQVALAYALVSSPSPSHVSEAAEAALIGVSDEEREKKLITEVLEGSNEVVNNLDSSSMTSWPVVRVYLQEESVTPHVREHLESAGVEIRPYDAILSDCAEWRREFGNTRRVWLDPKTTCVAIADEFGVSQTEEGVSATNDRVIEEASPISMMKARKNEAELDGMRSAHIKDAVAICDFLAQLEKDVCVDGMEVSETEIADRLEAARASQPGFLRPSFPTIAGVNSNGAIVHYRATEGKCSTLTKNDMLLLDSGGQYLDGTTDITRTMHFGTPTPEQRLAYTRVFKGHVALDRQIFPKDTSGCLLDTLARQHLWMAGLNYNHGTGHGVGAALHVHEGPQRISGAVNSPGLVPGMILSNEPGYYEPGKYGVRIENLVAVQIANELPSTDGRPWCRFESLTLVPIQTKPLDKSLLNVEEVDWLNQYHAKVVKTILPHVTSQLTQEWLKNATKPIAHKRKLPVDPISPNFL